MDVLLPVIIAFLSIAVPGVLLALALLKNTRLHLFEVLGIGLIFGLIAPATLTWIESYLMNYINFFAFSAELFEVNALLITIVAAAICYKEGVFDSALKLLSAKKGHAPAPAGEGAEHHANHQHNVKAWVWALLLILILITLYTRLENIGVSPTFFQFDSYFDMLNTQRLVALGYQPLYSTSAWPVMQNGTIVRVQPLIPYLEAYWYELAAGLNNSLSSFDTSLMSYVSSIYPPVTAALLVFVIFVLLYREYDEYVGLVGASLAASVPILFTTFVGGQQLLQPWGIFSLFFFFMAYMLAIRDPKSKRLAILAGVAFASTFLGAHYYTVDAGVLALYIAVQGIINSLRGRTNRDFYRMNIIVFAVIAAFLVAYEPYNAVYGGGLPSILGIPIVIGFPALSLLFVAVVDLVPGWLAGRRILFKDTSTKAKAEWLAIVLFFSALALLFTPLGSPLSGLVNLSIKFTTPSTPLFMTVQEYAPTGLFYNFGAAGMGVMAASFFGVPVMVYLLLAAATALLLGGIFYRKSDTSVFYLFISFPLAVAAFSEVAYIPHFSAAYVILFGIVIGEIGVLAGNGFKLQFHVNEAASYLKKAYVEHKMLMYGIFTAALFFLSPFIALAFILSIIFIAKPAGVKPLWVLFILIVLFEGTTIALGQPMLGEAASITQAFSAASVYASNQRGACGILENQSNSAGLNLFCNQIPQYWLNAMAFIKNTVGPNGARVLSWWDYGDWINWFGQSHAVLRGDNSVPKEDFATAAMFVLGQNYSYGPSALENFMNTNQTKYVLFDQDLIGKWSALDFLACVNINATSRAFAISQGKQQSPPQSFVLGTSTCEVSHDPEFALVPLPVIAPSIQQPSLSNYCSISSNSTQYAQAYLVIGSGIINQSACVSLDIGGNGAARLYSANGSKLNAYISFSQQPLGATKLTQNGPTYLQYLVIYTPDGQNGTITNAPTQFYSSNYYKGFFLGSIPGMTAIYPTGSAGKINYLNGTYPVRIYELNNFTGTLPRETPKPSYVANNYTIP